MVRSIAITAVLLAAVAGTADARRHGAVASPNAWVKVSSCSRADQSAVFYSRMRRLARGQRMAMRFTLLERGRDGRFARVDAPALKRWRRSKPGVKAFGYRQRVRGLAADSAYRARVDYRWYDADGELQRKARRRSGVCSQSGPLPNLRARIAGSAPTAVAGLRRYTVRLSNSGLAGADDVKVRLAVEGSSSETKTVTRRLEPGDFAFVSFTAPACTSAVTTDADPADEINEPNEVDNTQRLSCADLPG